MGSGCENFGILNEVCFVKGVRTSNDNVHKEYMFSARTENGPVTPSMVRGWMENLRMTCSQTLGIDGEPNIYMGIYIRVRAERRRDFAYKCYAYEMN